MENKTKGSWLIHHTNKLQGVTNQSGYESTFLAGKAGILLSSISANEDATINNDKLEVLANASNINTTFELPVLIKLLQEHELIDVTKNGIAVLGVTTSSTLQHTSNIFEKLKHNNREAAAIDLAERASLKPLLISEINEEIIDLFKLSNNESKQLFSDAESIGFIDTEKLENDEKLLFNGNLFRRETTKKIKMVLDSLKVDEQIKLNDLTLLLGNQACIDIPFATKFLGESLFEKVTAIGLFDISVVSNSKEDVGFLTLPSAFSKYSNAMVDDAFDLAKAFVSSITYGMTKSTYTRGKIQMVDALLNALVRGEYVGPVEAISEDYKILELKGVVKVVYGQKKGRTGPILKLLKKEVGELALQAIRQGDVSEHSLSALPSAKVTSFKGPESNREAVRRKQLVTNPLATNSMLSILRTGK